MTERGSDILAFTVSYGDRHTLTPTVREMRAAAGTWYDHAVFLGRPSPALEESARRLLEDPDRLGIQYLVTWPENRGQHFAFREALAIARARGYTWLLRLDDDVRPKTKGWLQKMLRQLEELRTRTGDGHYRIIAAPKIVGLKNPLQPIGLIEKGQPFPAEVMDALGGACRLHPMELIDAYEPDIYAPIGRGDPEGVSYYLERRTTGMLVRFPSIRVVHDTRLLEDADTEEQAHARRMSHIWPALGPWEAA